MRKLAIAAVISGLIAAAFGYYYFLYPPSILKHSTQKALEDFSLSVATKDRAKIGVVLGTFLTPAAQIHLEVGFFSLAQLNVGKALVQEFDRPAFITFIDNTLYSLQDWGFETQLDSFNLSRDRKTAELTFTSQEWADGLSYYAGTSVNMRFSADTLCDGTVVFEGTKPTLDKANCRMQLRSIPKPGQEQKLQSPEVLKELLR